MRYILGIIFMILCLHIQSQNKKLRSFSRDQTPALLDSAQAYVDSNPALAFDFATQALADAIKSGDEASQGACYIIIGHINYKVEQYDLAIDNYTKGLNVLVPLNNKAQQKEINGFISKAYSASNALAKSEDYYKKSLKFGE